MTDAPSDIPAAPDPDRRDPFPAATVAYTDVEVTGQAGEWPNAVRRAGRLTVDGDRRSVERLEPTRPGRLPAGTDREFVGAADRWATVADHDHAVGVAGFGRKPRPFVVSEAYPGDCRDRLGSVDVDFALWLGVAVAAALAYAHDRNVVHGFLTPASVRLRPTGREWDYPAVADWGVAEVLRRAAGVDGLDEAEATAFHRRLAPEHVAPDRYGEVTPSTDVYGLGLTLYELLTGERPHVGTGDAPVDGDPTSATVVGTAPVPPTTVAPDLPAVVDDLLLDALRTDPEDRYDSVADFRDRLVARLETEVGGGVDSSTVEAPPAAEFPFLDGDRAQWRADCPTCGRAVNNTFESFLAHWRDADRCDGPPVSAPTARAGYSDAEWAEVVARVREAIDAVPSNTADPGGASPATDHPLWVALADGGTRVVEVGGVAVDSHDGSFPWLSYPRRGWRVPCPACGDGVYNARSAMKAHWSDAPNCAGPPDRFDVA